MGNEEKKLKGKKAKDAKRQQQLQEKKEKLEQARLKHQQRLTSAKGDLFSLRHFPPESTFINHNFVYRWYPKCEN